MEKIVPIIDIPYGKIAERVIVCGDPKRAERISKRLDHTEVVAQSREYWTYNGEYKGIPVSVASHGVGGNGASVCFEGLILGGAKTIIRVGTCGTLQDDIPQSSLIIATAACREDGITPQFIPLSYPAMASIDVVNAMISTAKEVRPDTRAGIITTSGLFYKGLLETNNKLYREAGVLAMENEASVLFTIASVRGIKAGCVVVADGPCFEFVGSEEFDHYPEKMAEAQEQAITIALESIIKVES